MPALISAAEDYPDDRTFMLELYQKYHHLMFLIAGKYNSHLDVCEEIVQESLLKLIKKAALLRKLPSRALTSYIVSAVRNTAINYLKSEKEYHAHNSSLDTEAHTDLEAPLPSLDELMQCAEKTEHLLAVFERLSAGDRILLEGKYILGYSDALLADTLGCKEDSIRMKLTRARRRALNLLEREEAM